MDSDHGLGQLTARSIDPERPAGSGLGSRTRIDSPGRQLGSRVPLHSSAGPARPGRDPDRRASAPARPPERGARAAVRVMGDTPGDSDSDSDSEQTVTRTVTLDAAYALSCPPRQALRLRRAGHALAAPLPLRRRGEREGGREEPGSEGGRGEERARERARERSRGGARERESVPSETD